MKAAILSIGDELALGQTVDTNSAHLAARLASLGIGTLFHHTVADDQPAIAEAIQLACDRCELVLISGGLGPTDDDLTREALAEAMGVPLVEDPPSVEHLRDFFAKRGRDMPERNRKQANHPRGSTVLRNDHGTAPGIRAELGKAQVFVMPGVPRELFAMFEERVVPHLDALRHNGDPAGQRTILTTKINTFGLGESDVADRLGDLMARDRNPTVGTTVSDGFCCVRLRSEYADHREAENALTDTVAGVNERLGPLVFGRDDDTLQASLVKLLDHHGGRLATAESCTGGLIAKMLTDVPGCSMAYVGGWVTYSNAMKLDQLDVPLAMIDEHGAVSEQVARQMVLGTLRHCFADYALSVTGIAGPDGGTEQKPVGTVWFGMGWRDEANRGGIVTVAAKARLGGDRDAIRDRSAKIALQMLRLHLIGQPLDLMGWVNISPTRTHAPTCESASS